MKSNGSVRRERPTSVVILAPAEIVGSGGGGNRRPWLKICLSLLFVVSAVIIIVSGEWLFEMLMFVASSRNLGEK